jgi:hypothetical protein
MIKTIEILSKTNKQKELVSLFKKDGLKIGNILKQGNYIEIIKGLKLDKDNEFHKVIIEKVAKLVENGAYLKGAKQNNIKSSMDSEMNIIKESLGGNYQIIYEAVNSPRK